MSLYRYEALAAGGKIVTGTIDAGTPAEARAALRDDGVHATRLEEAVKTVSESRSRTARPWLISGRRIELLATFSRHLSLLLKAGLPLTQALGVLAEQFDDVAFRDVIRDITVRVKEGAALDEALKAHPALFPELFVCVARAGAASGSLAAILTAAAAYYTRQKRLRERVVSALLYPALMAAIGSIVVVFLMTFVVPKVTTVLLEQQRALPWPTELLLTLSNALTQGWPTILGGLIVLGAVSRVVLRTRRGQLVLDRLLLRLPILGELFRKQAVARWADTMSNLLASGIPVAQALSIVKGALGNRVLAQDMDRIESAVVSGQDLSEALKDIRSLPKSIGFVVGVGEETGELARVLREIADGYNEEVELVAGRITDLINPILIVVLGLAVGFIVAAILLPITDFSQIS